MGLKEKFKDALLERIYKIPIMETLQIRVLTLDEGYCETRIPRKPDSAPSHFDITSLGMSC